MDNTAYIVAYVMFKTQRAANNGILTDKNSLNHYEVFRDGTKKQNKKAANEYYKASLKNSRCYSSSLTKVVKSTDY